MWIKNTSGKKDAMLTFAFISFVVATINVLLSTVGTLNINDFSITFQALDASVLSTYLGIAFSAYVGRRWTDKKYTPAEPASPVSPVLNESTEPPPSMM